MPGYLAVERVGWVELLLVLAAGTTVIVLAAMLSARWFRSAVWQRTIWQAATIAALGLVVVESVGAGSGLVGWLRAAWPSTAGPAGGSEEWSGTGRLAYARTDPGQQTSRSDTPCLTPSTQPSSGTGAGPTRRSRPNRPAMVGHAVN